MRSRKVNGQRITKLCIFSLTCIFISVWIFSSPYRGIITFDEGSKQSHGEIILCECDHPGSRKEGQNSYTCSDHLSGKCPDDNACVSLQGRLWPLHEKPCTPHQLVAVLEGYGIFDGISLKAACARTYALADRENAHRCADYEKLELIKPNCKGKPDVVPRILHTVGKNAVTRSISSIALSNADYRLNTLDDKAAGRYVRNKCGKEAGEAYRCLNAAAFRGDLFRYCALYTEGGIYLDQDILPLKSLDEMFSRCSSATLGHDFPMNGRPAKQTKMMAAAPKTEIMLCAVQTIIGNVQQRAYPESPLEISATLVMQKCFEKHPEDVAITYIDTRVAIWPYSGMRAGDDILAYEQAAAGSKHFVHDPFDYAELTAQRAVYADDCRL